MKHNCRSLFVLTSALLAHFSASCGKSTSDTRVYDATSNDLELAFSHTATTQAELEAKGLRCIAVNEPADPDTWSDNSFCFNDKLRKVQWSSEGKIPGLNCRQIAEPAEPESHSWMDNYLCFAPSARYEFRWSFAGADSLLSQGFSCIQWDEPADHHTWSDNHLCFRPITSGLQTCLDGQCSPAANEDEKYPLRADEACGEPLYKLGVSEVCGPTVENGVEMYREGKCGEQPKLGPNLACPGSIKPYYVSSDYLCPDGTVFERTEQRQGDCPEPLNQQELQCPKISYNVCRGGGLNSCRTPENGMEDIICRSAQFGIERAAECRNRIFGIESYQTCRLRKNRTELERFIMGFESSYENFAILIAENYSGYLAATKGRAEMGCFLKGIQGDVLLSNVFDKNRALFSALFGGEVWEADNFADCSGASSEKSSILNEECDGQSDLRKCGFVKGYKSAFNWLKDQLTEARLLAVDRIARDSAAEAEKLSRIVNKVEATLKKTAVLQKEGGR